MKYLFWWLYAAVPVTLVCVLFYAVSQQVYRQDLNDPQIQMAEDAAARLGQGAVSAEIVPHGTPLVDLGNSLAPWIAVYDSNGQILEASGQLDNAPPALPKGVFDTSQWLAHPNGLYYNQSPIAQNRFTWQPQPDVRQAVILTQTKDKKYFVASGRNVREVEQRIEHEGEMVGVGWLGTLGAVLVVELAYAFFVRRVADSGSRRS